MASDPARAARLRKVFNAFLFGERAVSTTKDAELFLEASQTNVSASLCLEAIISNKAGLSTVKLSVRASSSPQFILNHLLPFVSYLSHPEAKALCDGTFLRQILVTILDPPTAWNSIIGNYLTDGFEDKNLEAFAWLCLETLTCPGPELEAIVTEIKDRVKISAFTNDSSSKVQEYGYRIQKVMDTNAVSGIMEEDLEGPGGRHDNDFADFRKIAIYPTPAELTSTRVPFYRLAAEVTNSDPAEKSGIHLDNQFRLLREDMLAELREDLEKAIMKKKSRSRLQILGQLSPVGIDVGGKRRGRYCALVMSVGSGLEELTRRPQDQRQRFLKENFVFLRNHSFGALICGDSVVGFAFVIRNVEKLSREIPLLSLRFYSSDEISSALSRFHGPQELHFVLINTPVYAYEPVLQRLQEMTEIPFDNQLLHGNKNLNSSQKIKPCKKLEDFLEAGQKGNAESNILRVGGQEFDLDGAQANALTCALEEPVAVIQGPPGTGKSFVGALAAKLLLEGSQSRILVLSYTNHALDQFLEDLMKIGIDGEKITRLGSKSTAATASLSFERTAFESGIQPTKQQAKRFHELSSQLTSIRECARQAFDAFVSPVSLIDVLSSLEFLDGPESFFWGAFQIPQAEDGFIIAGGNGQEMKADYLLQRWLQGADAGPLKDSIAPEFLSVWDIPSHEREAFGNKWVKSLREEHTDNLKDSIKRLMEVHHKLDALDNETKCAFIKTKNVIGCTTTAAAKYASLIKAAEPEYILVEEAGEILEAHVLTALGPATRGLILIGDHKQLRPKCANYALSVEKGAGYDLNRSLFERLILQGHAHTTLRKQHRMVPEISHFIRSMTYADLEDAEKTLGRPSIRGIRERVVFVNHSHQEGLIGTMGDRLDAGQNNSKENKFEADMILKTVRFLGQQGYKTENIVVLTPYLGQLRLLLNLLSRDSDPMLSDLDSNELVRMGLLTEAAGKVGKGRIRLSTIDNYQGEESDIVVASLTRSNDRGDIGFMRSPERLNVLLSRARNGIILFGNMETFLNSTQGQDCWLPFFTLMKEKGYLQDALIVHCEQHPERKATLSTPEDFDLKCPDGGCAEICGAELNCGTHTCQRRCHRIADHSAVVCIERVKKVCKKKHSYEASCGEPIACCPKCLREDAESKMRAARDAAMETDRSLKQERYKNELVLQSYNSDDDTSDHTADGTQSTPNEQDAAGRQWEAARQEELAGRDVLGALTRMIGLESVKRDFLDMKEKIDSIVREDGSPIDYDFGIQLLGNHGTGKTTVAELYFRLLSLSGMVASGQFVEIAAAKLVQMGLASCKKFLQDVLDGGGGVIHIKGAHELSLEETKNSSAILQFLFAEVENQRSKICFVLSGCAEKMKSLASASLEIDKFFPRKLVFEDFKDEELLRILQLRIDSKYGERMTMEDGFQGLYCRILAKRLGCGRGREDFGNAHAVENELMLIYQRQVERLHRQTDPQADGLLLTRDDLIGPEPKTALLRSSAWSDLQKHAGLGSVTESINSLVDDVQTNYRRELDEEQIIDCRVDRLLLGNSATSRMIFSRLYGRILADIGVLSNGEVLVRNAADFVGTSVKQSVKKTKAMLAAAVGKVLVIDKVSALDISKAVAEDDLSGPCKNAVIDAIARGVPGAVGNNRCVLLLGCREEMEEILERVNSGFGRRFPLRSAFVLEEVDQLGLESILDMKLKQDGFRITEKAEETMFAAIDQTRDRPDSNNIDELYTLLKNAATRHSTRVASGASKRRSTLEVLDFENHQDNSKTEFANTNIKQLFSDMIECGQIISKLEGYQQLVQESTARREDPKQKIPFAFIFRGLPGTGKLEGALKLAKVFYDAGFLSSAKVKECSASTLIATGGKPDGKVLRLFDNAAGSVVVISDLNKLLDGPFAEGALEALAQAAWMKKYYKRLVVILVGSAAEVANLFEACPRLKRNFAEVWDFSHVQPVKLLAHFQKELLVYKPVVKRGGAAFRVISGFERPAPWFRAKMLARLRKLSEQCDGGHERILTSLAGGIFQAAVKEETPAEQDIMPVAESIFEAEVTKVMAGMGDTKTEADEGMTEVEDGIARLDIGSTETDLMDFFSN